MAKKVNELKFEYKSAKSKRKVQFSVDIMLSADMTFFYRKEQIPTEIGEWRGNQDLQWGKRQYFSRFEDVAPDIQAYISEFEQAHLERSKEEVILLTVRLRGQVDLGVGHKNLSSLRCEEFDAIGLTVHWTRAFRITTGKSSTMHERERVWNSKTKTHSIKVGREIDFDSDTTRVMAWTSAREQWLQQLDLSLGALIQKVYLFFDRPDDQMAQIMDSGRLLPFGKGK